MPFILSPLGGTILASLGYGCGSSTGTGERYFVDGYFTDGYW